MTDGWIKLHRKIVHWEWYKSIPTRTLFIHLLLTVNREAKEWHGIEILPGQKVTSLPNLAKETGLTIDQTRTALNHMQTTGEITDKVTNKYRLITLNNWSEHQEDPRQIPRNFPGKSHATSHHVLS